MCGGVPTNVLCYAENLHYLCRIFPMSILSCVVVFLLLGAVGVHIVSVCIVLMFHRCSHHYIHM